MNVKSVIIYKNIFLSLAIFVLALLPRAYDLQRFVTADEAKWVYRSAQFLAAFLQGDFAGTTVNLTPAVTTTWLGSLGLTLYYALNQATINQPFLDWLLSLPEFRTELDILAVTRWPMVILTSLGAVAIYWLARYLFHPNLALLAATLIALDPHTVALSRVLGHDAPVTIFMILSLLLLLLALSKTNRPNSDDDTGPATPRHQLMILTLSGVSAGLAFLSKSPAFFLVPFAGLMFIVKIWQSDQFRFFLGAKLFVLWGGVAFLTFSLVWPAAWLDPVGRPLAVIENAVLSATDEEEAEAESFWLVPDLGPFYYLINGGFKLSPLVMIGTGLALIFLIKNRQPPPLNPSASQPPNLPISQSPTFMLFSFIILFTIFMTLAGKRSPRYILPAFPALSVIAAVGWLELLRLVIPQRLTPLFQSSLFNFTFYLPFGVAALITLYPYAPYYFTYFNPLLGGSYTAPRWVKIGWGEGLDQVGRFLQRELTDSRVGTAYSSTVAPFFKGDLSGLDGEHLDYVVLYSKQVQSGNSPLLPGIVRYYQQASPLFSSNLNGIHYADVYRGPAVQPVQNSGPVNGWHPIGFKPLTRYGQIGETLEIDVLWTPDSLLPATPPPINLVPISSNHTPSTEIIAESTKTGQAEELLFSTYSLSLRPT